MKQLFSEEDLVGKVIKSVSITDIWVTIILESNEFLDIKISTDYDGRTETNVYDRIDFKTEKHWEAVDLFDKGLISKERHDEIMSLHIKEVEDQKRKIELEQLALLKKKYE